MNICVLFSLLLLLAPGGCPIYSIDVSTLEVPNDFQNELKLQSMLSSELHQFRNKLNIKEEPIGSLGPEKEKLDELKADPFDRTEQLHSVEDHLRVPHYAAASLRDIDNGEIDMELEQCNNNIAELCTKNSEETFMGSNLFGSYRKRCFSTEEIALMSARKDFELLMPKMYPHSLIADSIVYTLMKYFNSVNQVVKHMSDLETRRLLQRAFYDALGGYLKYYLVPVAQVSYYAGRIKLCTMQRLMALYRECLQVLNTNGNGWKMPEQDILARLKNVRIKPLQLIDPGNTENDAASCALLDHTCANEDVHNELMIVPLPHLEVEDSNGYLSNIFLPFKHRRIYNLRSPDTAYIMVKFYKTLINCYRFQGMSPKIYNQKLRAWIRESLQLHYRDEVFYPGLGGVLQIYETLTCPTKSSSSADQSPQNGKQPPELSESSDYEVMPEEVNTEKVQKNKKAKSRSKNRSGDNGKGSSTQRKQNRFARQHRNESENDFAVTKSGEECIDCDDESYVGYITAFLALFLLLLLLLICCCLRRSSKKSGTQKKQPPQKSTDEYVEPLLPATAKDKSEPQKTRWSSIFKKRSKKADKNAKLKNAMPSLKACGTNLNMSHGMSMVNSPREDVFAGPMSINEVEKQTLRRDKSNDNSYDHDSFTSTSSLNCQFPRKCIPLSVNRDKRVDYYGKMEKKRSKTVKKQQSCEAQRGGEFDGNHCFEDSPKSKHRETLRTIDENLKKKTKHKRQMAGLAHSQENESELVPESSKERLSVRKMMISSSKVNVSLRQGQARPSESESSQRKDALHGSIMERKDSAEQGFSISSNLASDPQK